MRHIQQPGDLSSDLRLPKAARAIFGYSGGCHHPEKRMRPVLIALAFAYALLPASAQEGQPRRDLIIECMACHGDDGIAKDKEVPHLAGQNYDYLLKQLRDFQKGRRPHKEMRVMSRLMTDFDLEEIADFYARLPRDPK
jgi:cytochrome c553